MSERDTTARSETAAGHEHSRHWLAQAHSLARVAHAVQDRTAAPIVDAESPKIACRAGCSHCCHFTVGKVDISLAEALLLQEAIDALPVARRDMIVQRLLRHAEGGGPLDRRACALLHEDGRCSVYEARPAACRGLLAFDAAECARVDVAHLEQSLITISHPAHQMRLEVVRQLLAAQKKSLGSGERLYELEAALCILFDEPLAHQTLFEGKDILASARR